MWRHLKSLTGQESDPYEALEKPVNYSWRSRKLYTPRRIAENNSMGTIEFREEGNEYLTIVGDNLAFNYGELEAEIDYLGEELEELTKPEKQLIHHTAKAYPHGTSRKELATDALIYGGTSTALGYLATRK